jgi:hypothetical protein
VSDKNLHCRSPVCSAIQWISWSGKERQLLEDDPGTNLGRPSDAHLLRQLAAQILEFTATG